MELHNDHSVSHPFQFIIPNDPYTYVMFSNINWISPLNELRNKRREKWMTKIEVAQ